MLEKFKNQALTNEQMKKVSGGEWWDCYCWSGGSLVGGFTGEGDAGDFREQTIEAGCANTVVMCYFQ